MCYSVKDSKTRKTRAQTQHQVERRNQYRILNSPLAPTTASENPIKEGGKSSLDLTIVEILCWNARGLNARNKQKEVKPLCNDVKVSLIG